MAKLIYVGTVGNIEVRREEGTGAVHLTGWKGIPGAHAAGDPVWSMHLTPEQGRVMHALFGAAIAGVLDPLDDWQKISTSLQTTKGSGGTSFSKPVDEPPDA